MLRFWAEREGFSGSRRVWRFSLEDPHTGQRQGFSNIDGLVAFLKNEIGSNTQAKPPPEDESTTPEVDMPE